MKMHVILLLITGLLFLSLADSYATETRVGSMGGVGYFMRDNSNIFVFPGTFYSYQNQVVGELRVKNNDALYTIGVNLPVASNTVLGAYLNSPLNLIIPANVVDNVELDRASDIFYGTKLADFDLGLNLRVGLDKFTNDADTLEESARYFAVGAGLSNEKMDLGLLLEFPGASLEEGSYESTWSGFGVGFNGRFWLEKKGKFQLLPVISGYYGSSSREIKPGGGATTLETDYSNLQLAGALGVNYELNEDNLLVLGLEAIGYSKLTTKVKDAGELSTSTMTLPGIYMGIESKISDWLIGRFGAAQVFQSTTFTSKPDGGSETETTSYASEFKMTFGLGVSFGSFLLDMAINEGLLFDGPNFISGTNEPIATRLSITYAF
jgi:hypothetical protein